MTTIRIKAIPTNGFRHGGLIAGKAWEPVPVTALTGKSRAALRDFHGRFVLVHQDDRAALAELGLAFKDAKGPLVDQESATAPARTSSRSGARAAGKDS